VGVGFGVGVGVKVGVLVGIGVHVAVTVAVGVGVQVGVSIQVGVRVGIGVRVAIAIGVEVGGAAAGVACGGPHPTSRLPTNVRPMICCRKLWRTIVVSSREGTRAQWHKFVSVNYVVRLPAMARESPKLAGRHVVRYPQRNHELCGDAVQTHSISELSLFGKASALPRLATISQLGQK